MRKNKNVLLSFALVFMLSIGLFVGNFFISQGQGEVVADARLTSAPAVQPAIIPISASSPGMIEPIYYPMGGTVKVQGEGVISVEPDVAYISVGVETSNKDMSVAQKENKDKMNKIMSQLEKMGVKKDDIKTQNYSVYPDYKWDEYYRNSQLIGYKVNNTLRITVRNIDDCGNILDAMADLNANVVGNIEFGVFDTSKAYQKALKLAIKNAEDKAKVMTGYFGEKTLTPVNIEELSSNSYMPYPIYKGMDAVAESSTPISAGQTEIRASVSIQFNYN